MNFEDNGSNTQLSLNENNRPFSDEEEINLFDLVMALLKHKYLIIATCAVVFILSIVITILMPDIYIGSARILPPQENKGGLTASIGGISDLAALAGISASGSTGELYVGMLKSRTVADAIIDEFKLMDLYRAEFRVNTYKELEDHVSISLNKDDGIINVSVEDEDPQRAAAMANKYVDELKKLNVRLNLSNAGRERVFLEHRLARVKKDLGRAEDNLKLFQEANKAIRIDDQANATIDAIAALKAQITGKEVELGVLRLYQTEQNPQVKALIETISQLKSQLNNLEENPAGKSESADIFITTSNVPELGVQYTRLMREFKIQETLFELLTKQYEMAKINEARDTSTIQILDEAVVPDRKSKPKRILIVLIMTFIALFLSMVMAFSIEFSKRYFKEYPDSWRDLKSNFSLH